MKNLNLVFVVLALSTLGGIGCAHNKTDFVGDDATGSTDKSGHGLSGKVEWAKHKNARLDASVILSNNYPFPIVIDTNSWTLEANGKTGSIIAQGFMGSIPEGGVVQGVVKFDMLATMMPPIEEKLTLRVITADKNSTAGNAYKGKIAPLSITFTVTK
jgi:hypothetical protein